MKTVAFFVLVLFGCILSTCVKACVTVNTQTGTYTVDPQGSVDRGNNIEDYLKENMIEDNK